MQTDIAGHEGVGTVVECLDPAPESAKLETDSVNSGRRCARRFPPLSSRHQVRSLSPVDGKLQIGAV